MARRARAASAALLAVLALLPALQAQAQQPEPSAEDQIRAFDQQWGDAEVGHDRKTLERILDEGFVATFNDGTTFEKATFIDFVMRYKFPSSFKVAYEFIRVHGDTAITVCRFGFSDPLRTKVTSVYLRRNGEWRVIAEQMTELAPSKPVAAPSPAQK
jgi:uncharacterized protein DUF4440